MFRSICQVSTNSHCLVCLPLDDDRCRRAMYIVVYLQGRKCNVLTSQFVSKNLTGYEDFMQGWADPANQEV